MVLAPLITGKNPNEAQNVVRKYSAKITDGGNTHLQAFVSAFSLITHSVIFAFGTLC
jgi:hypothetical protein